MEDNGALSEVTDIHEALLPINTSKECKRNGGYIEECLLRSIQKGPSAPSDVLAFDNAAIHLYRTNRN